MQKRIYAIKENALKQYKIIPEHAKKHKLTFIFFHPDYTVGFGISPNHAFRLVGCTTGRESHPALKNSYFFYKFMICTLKCFVKVFLIIKNNIVKEIIFLALYVVWLFVSVVIILAACTISIVSAIPAAVISITSVSLVINIVFATAAVF